MGLLCGTFVVCISLVVSYKEEGKREGESEEGEEGIEEEGNERRGEKEDIWVGRLCGTFQSAFHWLNFMEEMRKRKQRESEKEHNKGK